MAVQPTNRQRRLRSWGRLCALALFGICAALRLAAQQAATAPEIPVAKSAIRLRLTVPAVAAQQHLSLVLQAGPLPAGAALVVFDEKGELIGSVSPFGAQERKSGGSYTLPLTENLKNTNRLTVRCAVQLDSTHWRKPSSTELVKIAILADAAQ